MAHKEFGKEDIHQIPIRRMIEPAAHAKSTQSSPEIVGAVRFTRPLRIWPRLHCGTAVHGHLFPHPLCNQHCTYTYNLTRNQYNLENEDQQGCNVKNSL